jgi:predicted ATPase
MCPFPTLKPRPGTVTRIEAHGYRSLRYVDQPLSPFDVLVGPNASGKSTFLDVIGFFGDLLRAGVEGAIQGDLRLRVPQRAPDGRHLVSMREGTRFELAVEMTLPVDRKERLRSESWDQCRYEIAVDVAETLRLAAETLWLRPAVELVPRELALFPDPPAIPKSIVTPPRKRTPEGWKKVLSRGEEPERVNLVAETSGFNNPLRLGAGKAALASVPDDEDRFPVATWLRQALLDGVQRIVLSSEAMRMPSPPGRSMGFLPDGSNLPWVVHLLEKKHPDRLKAWIDHLREALPDLRSVSTSEQPSDRSRFLILHYTSGLEAPSWLVSDGTLRLLALTLLAYLPEVSGIYLIEEPENGIHPRALESVFQSLSSVYSAQVLCATHSPVILSMAEPANLLCFARTLDGATDIVRGTEHPRLRTWRGAVDLGTLFASGVLG